MAYCPGCGTQMADHATFCPGCGRPAATAAGTTGASGSAGQAAGYPATPAPPNAQPLPISADEAKGFVAALFDLSFTSFVATKLIKVLFVLCIVVSALLALGLVASAFSQSAAAGLLTLVVVAPIVFLISVIYTRVLLEIIIVIFRMAEHLAEIAEQGRRGLVVK